MRPKITLILAAFSLIMLTNFQLTASTFYVDSLLGNDSNPGTHEQPFQTIEKINSLKLQPGDSVYFAGGQTFNGTLRLKSLTGTEDQTIHIGSLAMVVRS